MCLLFRGFLRLPSSGNVLARAYLDAAALHCGADYFSNHGLPGQAAWHTVRQTALAWGVRLTLSRDGAVQAQTVPRFGTTLRKRYPGDDQCYTLAETIEFVFALGGSFAFAMQMWIYEMSEYKKYIGYRQCYTLAEIIALVVARGGSFGDAINVWNNEMVSTVSELI